jgi:hypothetical protein
VLLSIKTASARRFYVKNVFKMETIKDIDIRQKCVVYQPNVIVVLCKISLRELAKSTLEKFRMFKSTKNKHRLFTKKCTMCFIGHSDYSKNNYFKTLNT